MMKLQRRIKQLRAEIEEDKVRLKRDSLILKKRIQTPQALTVALSGGFLLGFFFGKRAYIVFFGQKAQAFVFWGMRVFKKISFLLPLVSR